ncbi:MAG TPA: hypothetical protein VFA53_02980 [Xanthobacteraceae bacterium]|nr:hypothetical protein [Xanthobacteraceae bacterium]
MNGRLQVLIILMFLAVPAHARWKAEYGSSTPELQAWYREQHNARGEWCCDKSDGHAFFGDYKLNEDGSVSFEFQGRMHTIPTDMVLHGPNPTGHAVWWYVDSDEGRQDYCFAPGTLT